MRECRNREIQDIVFSRTSGYSDARHTDLSTPDFWTDNVNHNLTILSVVSCRVTLRWTPHWFSQTENSVFESVVFQHFRLDNLNSKYPFNGSPPIDPPPIRVHQYRKSKRTCWATIREKTFLDKRQKNRELATGWAVGEWKYPDSWWWPQISTFLKLNTNTQRLSFLSNLLPWLLSAFLQNSYSCPHNLLQGLKVPRGARDSARLLGESWWTKKIEGMFGEKNCTEIEK